MTNHGKVRGTVKPHHLSIDDYSVWVNSNIESITENSGQDNEFIGYHWDMTQYTKDEYIELQAERNDMLEISITDTQVALCDVYELIGNGEGW